MDSGLVGSLAVLWLASVGAAYYAGRSLLWGQIAMKWAQVQEATLDCDLVPQLQAAVQDACELAEEGWGYASPYFREKWESDLRLRQIRAAAGLPDRAH